MRILNTGMAGDSIAASINNSDDGKRLFTTVGSDTKFSIISDDADFYDDIVATAGTALQSLGFKFYSGTIGTLNPRVEFRSASGGATTQLDSTCPILHMLILLLMALMQ